MLSRKDGRTVTVEDFLADVELIKAGLKPKLIEIGLERTEFQKLEDETNEQKRIKQASQPGQLRYLDSAANQINQIQSRKKKE